jgi:hypothetical protein
MDKKETLIYRVTHEDGEVEFFAKMAQAENVCRENYYDSFDQISVTSTIRGANLYVALLNNKEWMSGNKTIWLEEK